MNTIYFNANISDDARRERLYAGQLFVYTASDGTRALCAHAREMAEEAFGSLDPRYAQHDVPVDDFVAVLATLKPKFIHHPKSKVLIQDILKDLDSDLSKTYFDVPRLRTSTSHDYLTSGLAYVFKPHRDTWYSAPQCQLNWWLPIYDVASDNVMAIPSRYWDRPVKNDSYDFNYQEWTQTGRKNAAKHIKSDTRKQTEAQEELELNPQIHIVAEPGGLMIFSGAQLHSSVANTSGQTRLSIDFRTVHLDDLKADRGAPNIDSACTGTTINDYLSGADLTHLPDKIISRYEEMTRPTGLSRAWG